MLRFTWRCWPLSVAVMACGTPPPPQPTPVPAEPVAVAPTPAPKPLTSADELCSMLFEAPRRHLAGQCSVQDERTKAFEELDELIGKRVEDCRATLRPGMKSGRIQVRRAEAEACAKQIEAASWRVSLRSAKLTRFPLCAALLTGMQTEGQPCRLGLECASGLSCEPQSAKNESDSEGTCSRTVAERCDLPQSFLFGEDRAQCGAEAYCEGTLDEQPEYHLGYSPTGDVDRPRELAEFGMIGLLSTSNPGAIWGDSVGTGFGAGGLGLRGVGQGGGGTGQGIGLGSVGTTKPPGGHAKVGVPRVRMGKPAVGPKYPPEIIQRVVRQNFGRFRLCYEAGLKKDPSLEGKVTVKFTIAQNGTVKNVTASTTLSDKNVASCVRAAFYSLSFPKPNAGIITVSYPIVFKSSSGNATPSTNPPPQPEPEPEELRLSCEPLLEVGDACDHEGQCATGVCRTGECFEELGQVGELCDWYGECAPNLRCGYADDEDEDEDEDDDEMETCQPLLAAGESCDATHECEGACVKGLCQALCGAG